mgnify:CR=1 FL=1
MVVFEKEIAKAQIIMFPGGFSAGDEPDGSAKFFATALYPSFFSVFAIRWFISGASSTTRTLKIRHPLPSINFYLK